MFSTSLLFGFMDNLTKKHMGTAKKVLRYIQGNLDHGIEYVKGKLALLIGYGDSDWAGSEYDVKSTSRYTFNRSLYVFSWASIKQNICTLYY